MRIRDLFIRQLPEEKQNAAIQATFNRVFRTPDGQIVLAYILNDLCLLTRPRDAEDVARRNYATELLHDRMGVTDIFAFIEALMNTTDKEKPHE